MSETAFTAFGIIKVIDFSKVNIHMRLNHKLSNSCPRMDRLSFC